jgi:guanine nucleotide-binding protein subunit alpha
MEFILEFQVDPDPNIPLDPRLSAAVVAIYKDPCIPRVMEHQNEFYLMDSAP